MRGPEAQWMEITDTVHDVVAHLDLANGRDASEVSLRLLKLTEEVGEVAQAWIGLLGQNPRKGVVSTWDDVADELGDVVITGLVALASIQTDFADIVAVAAHKARTRLDDHAAAVRAT